MIPNKLKSFIFFLIVSLLSACAAVPRPDEGPSDSKISVLNRNMIATLQNDLAVLDGHTNMAEARYVAETAIQYSHHLAIEYDLVRPATFHNVLVRIGLKDRGLCHHWTTDLMKQLERLNLQTYQLYWGVAHRGSELREHNSVVVAAKGHAFEKGIVLDPWRNSGDLYWGPVKEDRYNLRRFLCPCRRRLETVVKQTHQQSFLHSSIRASVFSHGMML